MDPVKWAEAHPVETALIIFGGGLAILYVFGAFGSGSTAATGSGNLAAAYYAAEAAQTTAGTDLQLATVQANAATDQAQIQANGAVAIANAQTTAATNVAGSMYGAQQLEALYGSQSAQAASAYGFDTAQVQAEYGYMGGVDLNASNVSMNASNNQTSYNTAIAGYASNDTIAATQGADSLAAANGAAYAQYLETQSTNNANLWSTAMNTIVPQELGYTGGWGNFTIPGGGTASVNTGSVFDINQAIAEGWPSNLALQYAQTGSP